MDLTAWITLGSVVLTVITTVIGAVWRQGTWIATQFAELKDFVNSKVDGVLDKLEYHEKHDDERFLSMRNDIWMLRLDNAQSKTYQDRDVRRETFPPGESGV